MTKTKIEAGTDVGEIGNEVVQDLSHVQEVEIGD